MRRRTIVIALAGLAVAAGLTIFALTRYADPAVTWPSSLPACEGFDFPVGAPDAVGYHDARPFRVDDHLGNDWNGNGGGDTDLGDPVQAISSGVVVQALDFGGDWGNIVRIVHGCGVESLYAHLDRIETTTGAIVRRGQRIGTIGTADGRYPAHLHLEIRDRPLPLGGGYDDDATGYLDPTAYIRAHRH